MTLALLAACGGTDATDADADADGFSITAGDCDDEDPAVSPDAAEVCDGVDQDCNSVVDDAPTDGVSYYPDDDGDGYGDPTRGIVACSAADGRVADGTDCDDTDPNVNPGASDTATRDRNCDGLTTGGSTTTPGPTLQSCDVEIGLCWEFEDYAGAEDWCAAFDDAYGLTTSYDDAPCASGAVLSCALQGITGAEGEDVTAYYYAPDFDSASASDACTQGGGTVL